MNRDILWSMLFVAVTFWSFKDDYILWSVLFMEYIVWFNKRNYILWLMLRKEYIYIYILFEPIRGLILLTMWAQNYWLFHLLVYFIVYFSVRESYTAAHYTLYFAYMSSAYIYLTIDFCWEDLVDKLAEYINWDNYYKIKSSNYLSSYFNTKERYILFHNCISLYCNNSENVLVISNGIISIL